MAERPIFKRPSRGIARHIRMQKSVEKASTSLLERFNQLNHMMERETNPDNLVEMNIERIWMKEKLGTLKPVNRVKELRDYLNGQPKQVVDRLYEVVGRGSDGRPIDRLMQIRQRVFPDRF